MSKTNLIAALTAAFMALPTGFASAQSTITLDSFDLDEPAEENTREPKPTEEKRTDNCLLNPDAPGCDRVNSSSRSFSLSDVVNLGIVERSEVETADEQGKVLKVEDRVDPLPSIDLEILFDYDSAALRPDQMAPLISLSRDLSEIDFTRAQLILMGHTDAVGSAVYNKELSLRRAQSVAMFLSEAADIPPYRIKASGMGFEYLKTPSTPESSINRRVQILLVE
ncbi:MAG: OmpA family protein [Sulfitobacter sp.]|nr:OmpA family protein [Sulfitobacter sp.]